MSNSSSERLRFPCIPIALMIGLVAFWSIDQIFRERFWVTGLCFFIPSPIVAVAALVVACGYWWKGFAARARWTMALAVVPCFVVGAVENRWTAPAVIYREVQSLRLVHWNIWFGTRGIDRVCEVLAEYDADVYVLSEVPKAFEAADIAQRTHAEYDSIRIGSLAVIAPGTLTLQSRFDIGAGFGGLVLWNNGPQTISLLVADLPSKITGPRRPLLMALHERIAEHQPDIIVGDLNVPRRSQGLTDLPAGYVHAYDSAGQGWSYTWPVVCPLWAIDQCITGNRIRNIRYGLRSTIASDHRLQWLDFEM